MKKKMVAVSFGLLSASAAWMPLPAQATDGINDLGLLNGGSAAQAVAVSADTNVVVGRATDGAAGNATRAFRWSLAGGMVSLGVLNGGSLSYANGVSTDGSVIIGTASDGAAANADRAFRWTTLGGMASLGVLNGGSWSQATGLSADGESVVGSATDGAAGNTLRGFRWTTVGGMTSLGLLNGGAWSNANAISADGNVVVGAAANGTAANEQHAFRWTSSGGMVSLGLLAGKDSSRATGVSADGSVVVGSSTLDSTITDSRAFRWTSGDGMVSLGVLNSGSWSIANGVSANGAITVGDATDGSAANAQRGFRWSTATGMQTVEQWLRDGGVSVATGLNTRSANATNSDGTVIVGQLDNGHAYLARLSPPLGSTGSEGGSGLIDVLEFNQSLAASAHPQRFASYETDIVMHGLHGSPMRNLLAAGQHSVWGGGDLGRQDHFNNRGTIDAGEAGYAYGLADHLMLKAAVGATYSENRLIYDGATTLHGNYLIPELIWRISDTSLRASASAYYNLGDARIRRGYFNAGMQDFSHGTTSVTTAALRLRLDWLNAVRIAATDFSPYASLTQYRSRIGAYTESGGGFPVRWQDRVEINTQARFGADAIYELGGNMNLIGRLEAVHRFEATSSAISGEILGLGGFSFTGDANKQNWLRAGFGVEGKAGPGFFSLMANATTQAQTPSAWVYASYRINF